MKFRGERGSPTHLGAMRIHAMRRLFQRHGLAITDAEFGALVVEIGTGKAPVLALGRQGGTVHALTIRGRTVHALWATDVDYIATFLPAGQPFELRYPEITEALRA